MNEKLMEYSRINDRINEMLDDIETLYSLAMKTTQTLSDMPHGGASSREEIYAKIADKHGEINAEIDRLNATKLELCQMIKKLDNKAHRKVLGYKYIKGKDRGGRKRIGYSFAEVAEAMGISRRWVITIHGSALGRLHKI